MDSWQKFMRCVEEAFGMTQQQLEDTFFALEPEQGEASAAFVMRVERERRSLGIDPNQAYHAFAKRFLDENLKAQLDQVRWAKKANGQVRWGWEDIVTVCRDVHTGCGLAPRAKAQTASTVPPAPPAPTKHI